jgi:3-dehydroquinate synthase
LLAESAEIAREVGLSGRAAVIADARIADRYGEPVRRSLQRAGVETVLLLVPPGERSKSLHRAERLLEALVTGGLDRSGFVVAVGGGVTGDLAGFVAATFMRGIPYVQAPTSLLAQVDSSVGGKTAVNLKAGKNLVGAFHQPRAVVADTETLRTLPTRDLRAGMAEVVKHGLIACAELFGFVEGHVRDIASRDAEVLTHIVRRSCEIKAEVVRRDERESDFRRVLNCGHTVGHGIETVGGPRHLRHGEAVALGLLAEMRIAVGLGLSHEADRGRLREALSALGLPVALPALDVEAVMDAMRVDKKAVRGQWVMALPSGIGHVRIVWDVPRRLVRRALEELTRHV